MFVGLCSCFDDVLIFEFRGVHTFPLCMGPWGSSFAPPLPEGRVYGSPFSPREFNFYKDFFLLFVLFYGRFAPMDQFLSPFISRGCPASPQRLAEAAAFEPHSGPFLERHKD